MRSFCAAVTAALTVASVDGKLFGALQSSLSYLLLLLPVLAVPLQSHIALMAVSLFSLQTMPNLRAPPSLLCQTIHMYLTIIECMQQFNNSLCHK